MDVSENSGTPKSSIFIGFSIMNHPFWGTLIFGNTHIQVFVKKYHFKFSANPAASWDHTIWSQLPSCENPVGWYSDLDLPKSLTPVSTMLRTGWWFQLSTHLKNISHIGNLPQIGVNIKMFETTTYLTIFNPSSPNWFIRFFWPWGLTNILKPPR